MGSQKGALLLRCGKCPNCEELERVRARILACANPPFSHVDDGVIAVWNTELERLPCDNQVVFPIVHLNGTSRKELMGQLERALTTLRSAEQALAEAAPHARDYYLYADKNAIKYAQQNHQKRVDRLQSVRSELQDIWESIENGVK